MTPESSQWLFNASNGIIFTGLLLFLVYLGITLFHLRQTGFTPMRLLTEGLKLLGAVFLFLTLLQPEVHHRSAKNEDARIAVIVDKTDSMNTQDVRDLGVSYTRKEWVENLMKSPEWAELADAVDLEILEVGHEDKPVLKETNLRAAIAQARDVEQLAAVLVLSDGAHNAVGSPLGEVLRLAEAEVPAYAVEVGASSRLPDLILEEVDFPSYSIRNEAMVIPIRVSNTLEEDAPTRVVLLADGAVVAQQDIVVPSGQTEDSSLRWIPQVTGPVSITVQVEPHPLEEFPDNNEQTAVVDIRKTTIKVLLIDSVPRWEFRYLRNALYRDPGVEVDSLLLHPGIGPQQGPGYLSAFPVSRDAWSSYDVVFLGDVGLGQDELNLDAVRNLELLVREQGSGLVFLPGPRGGHLRLKNTPLESLMPVEYDERFPNGVGVNLEMRMSLTREGQDHLLAQLHSSPARNLQIWRKLPGFYWYAGVARARVGSEVLATHSSQRNENGRIPLLATRNAGTGHVLFLGTDAAWRWRKGVEDLYHYRFWGQVVRWMAHKRHMFGSEGARVFIQPERPQSGQEITMTISLRESMDMGEEIPFRMRLTQAGGGVTAPDIKRLEGVGTFQATWTPETPGQTTLELLTDVGDGDSWFSTDFEVEGDIPEEVGVPLRPGILREMAQVTNGESVGVDDAKTLLAMLKELPRSQMVLTVNRVWQHPLWVIAVFAFFGFYWILRKRQGWV
jgi:hypothetical protein